jgi:hypothetical protein
MSHYTTIQTQIRDINALTAACSELGLSLVKNTTARGYAQPIKGEHVIKLKGPYDVAVNRQQDGTYQLTTDWWDGHVAKEVGEKYSKLLQLYGVHKTIIEARKKGLTVNRKPQTNGGIKLILQSI